MAATEGNASFALMLKDQLQDSPREQSAHARELKRMKFTEGPEDFNNILLLNQQLIMAATEAAKSAAYTVNQLSDILKAVHPSIVPQNERADPDPAPLGRQPPAPPPSTIPSQPREQREPVSTDQKPEKLSKIMERRKSWNVRLRFFANSSDTCIAQKEMLEQATETVKFFERKPFKLPIWLQTFLELHHVVRT